jgi:DNA-binding CsgD family transcriptional regulator
MGPGKDHAVAPASLRATYVSIDHEELLVRSYPVAPLRAPVGLTRAERDDALALAREKAMREIASTRGTSIRTVANQMRAIYAKLGVQSRTGLAR